MIRRPRHGGALARSSGALGRRPSGPAAVRAGSPPPELVAHILHGAEELLAIFDEAAVELGEAISFTRLSIHKFKIPYFSRPTASTSSAASGAAGSATTATAALEACALQRAAARHAVLRR